MGRFARVFIRSSVHSFVRLLGLAGFLAIPIALFMIAGLVFNDGASAAPELESSYSAEELDELVHQADPLRIDRRPGFSPIIYAD